MEQASGRQRRRRRRRRTPFSDGLTEEIIADLSAVRSLPVISRTSAVQLKGTKKNVREIGRELNVDYVLEGSVRKAGSDLRITAQLIDTRDDAHLWAEKYRGTLEDVFEIQETVSRNIVARRVVVKVELHAGESFPRVVLIVTSLERDRRAVDQSAYRLEAWGQNGNPV